MYFVQVTFICIVGRGPALHVCVHSTQHRARGSRTTHPWCHLVHIAAKTRTAVTEEWRRQKRTEFLHWLGQHKTVWLAHERFKDSCTDFRVSEQAERRWTSFLKSQ